MSSVSVLKEKWVEQWSEWSMIKKRSLILVFLLFIIGTLQWVWINPTKKILEKGPEQLIKAQNEFEEVKQWGALAGQWRKIPKISQKSSRQVIEDSARTFSAKLEPVLGSGGIKVVFVEASGSDIAKFLESTRESGKVLPVKASWSKSSETKKWNGYVEFTF